MKDFSEGQASPFNGLRRQQILTLLDVLQDSELKHREYIERRYLERAPRFEITLQFLTEIGAVQDDNSVLTSTPTIQVLSGHVTRQNLAQVLINLIVCGENRFRSDVFGYIEQFRVTDGRAVHRPTVEQRSAESGVRNFLMELDVVSYDASENQYVLSAEYSALYANARCPSLSVSPAELQRSRQEKEDIGLSAEIAVVSYERQRVGAQLADRVDHIARRNVAAGYDIRSISVVAGDRILPRYIEVKAVPAGTFRFYWSSNEVRVAESFGSWYYLYLLPIDRGGTFNLEDLWIIRDPHSVVLGSVNEWIVERGVLVCSPMPSAESRSATIGSRCHG